MIAVVQSPHAKNVMGSGSINTLVTPSGNQEAPCTCMILQWSKGKGDKSTYILLSAIDRSMLAMNLMVEMVVDPDATPSECVEDSPTPDIEILLAMAFIELLASDNVIKTFALSIRECHRLLKLTLEVRAGENPVKNDTINLSTT